MHEKRGGKRASSDMVRRGSTVRVRQRASRFRLLSGCFRCLDWRRLRASVSTQRPPASTMDVVRSSARRAGGSRARVRRGRGGRSGGRSWSGWRPCSGKGRRWRCRHGARRWRRCVGDRRSCAGQRRPTSRIRFNAARLSSTPLLTSLRALAGRSAAAPGSSTSASSLTIVSPCSAEKR
jgi:hypothetical protein